MRGKKSTRASNLLGALLFLIELFSLVLVDFTAVGAF